MSIFGNIPLGSLEGHGVPPSPSGKGPSHSGVQELEARVDQLNLVVQTLLRLLLEKGVIQEEEFKNWHAYLDGFDGARDGKLRKDNSPVDCPKCGRHNSRQLAHCLFCEAELPIEVLAQNRGTGPA